MWKIQEPFFIDLRSRQEYEKMHIKDAVNIPFEEMERQLQNNYSNRNAGFYDNSNDRSRAGGIVLNNIFYDRNTVFIVYCDRGSKMYDDLSEAGGKRISGEDSCRRDSSVSRKISCLSYRFL